MFVQPWLDRQGTRELGSSNPAGDYPNDMLRYLSQLPGFFDALALQAELQATTPEMEGNTRQRASRRVGGFAFIFASRFRQDSVAFCRRGNDLALIILKYNGTRVNMVSIGIVTSILLAIRR